MIQHDLPMEKYLAHPSLSSSQIKQILTTPADFKAALEQKNQETKFTQLGTAIHTLILEPDEFDKRYVLQPEYWGNRATLEKNGGGKGRWDELKKENPGKVAMTFEDAELLKRIHKVAKSHKRLQELLAVGKSEVTAFSNVNGLELKARTDLKIPLGMADVKTCSENLSDENIFSVIFKFGYHFQMAHHMACFIKAAKEEIFDYYWIFVSTQSPAIHIRVVECPEDLMRWGHRDHEIACNRISECRAKDEWPGYPPELKNMIIPEWARRNYE